MAPKRKRVCVVMGGHWEAVMGGAQYQAKCLVDEMVKGDELEIFYLARVINPAYRPEGYEIVRIAQHKGIRRYCFFFDAPNLRRLLDEIEPDVIYQAGLKSYTGIAASYARKKKCRLIFRIASDYDVQPFKGKAFTWQCGFKFLEKKIGEYGLRRAEIIVAQTRGQVELLRKNYGLNATVVVPNFHPLPNEVTDKQEPPVRIVWVANFKPVKRPEMFVRLAEDLRNEGNAEFIMIGRPGDPGVYSDLHRRISRTGNLNYIGERSLDEVNKILATSHIFVNTSIVEGFPNTFIQAWMRKVPVVTVCVNPDGVFDNGKYGFCDSTYEYLRESVRNLIDDSNLRETIGQAAQDHAFSSYSMANADMLISLMHQAD